MAALSGGRGGKRGIDRLGQIKPHRDGSRELASIAVQKGWRRQGIAAEIIQRLLADEPPPVWLTCIDRLVPFYEQFGFVEVKDGDGRSLPRTFRFIRTVFKAIQKLSRIPGYLAIMVWPSEETGSRFTLIRFLSASSAFIRVPFILALGILTSSAVKYPQNPL